MYRRGEIYYVNLGKKEGSNKQGGIRPVIIVSNNKANALSPIVTVVPLTSKIKKTYLPSHVVIPEYCIEGLDRTSMVLAEQVITIDKKELGHKAGRIKNEKIMELITVALQVQIGAIVTNGSESITNINDNRSGSGG